MRRTLRTLAKALTTPAMALLLFAAAPSSASAQVDLVLNLSDAPDPIPAGGVITYSIIVSNDWTDRATGVGLAMDVPANASYEGFSGAGITCGGMAVGQLGVGTVVCTLPELDFMESVAFTIDLKSTVSGLVNIHAEVSSVEPDLSAANNTVDEETTVVSGANVALSLTAPATVPSGSAVSFNMQLDNIGPDAASYLQVQFPIPTGFTTTGSLPGGCSSSGGTINCTVSGSIASGGTRAIGPFTGQIWAASGSTVTGVASVQVSPSAPPGTPQDPITSNNTSLADISVTAGSDVRITKARSVGGPYFVGDSFNFILSAFFTGDSPSTLTITDVLPGNYTLGTVAASQNGWNCGQAGQTVTCTRPSGGAAGENQSMGTVSIPVTINSSGVGVTNTADIGAASPFDPNSGNNTATDGGVTLQDPTADLVLSKVGPNPALVVVGYPFQYSLGVSNAGPSEFYGTLQITDQLPVGLTLNSVTENGWSCLPAPPQVGPVTLTCTRTYTSGSPLNSGANTPTVVLNTTATAIGSIVNAAALTTTNPNVADPNTGNNSTTREVTSSLPPNAADIRVIKSVDLATVPAGEVLTYTLEIVNDGPVASNSVTLTDNLGTLINSSVGPTGAGYVGHTITNGIVTPGDLTCSSASTGGTSRRLTCQVTTLPVCTAGGDCPTIDVAIRPGGDGGNRSNLASVISTATADTVLANNDSTVNSTILARADVTVTKTASPSPAFAGQDLVYVVTALNNGPSRADGVTITDLLPVGVYFVSASGSGVSCPVTPGAGVVTTAGNRTVICNLPSINNGAQRTVTIRVKPTNATRGNTITNDVTVATTTTEPTVPGATNNTASVDVDVSDPALDLLINKNDDLDPVAVAETTTYEVRVTNVGPSDAENVVITDDLPPAGLSFQGYSFPAGVCTTVPAVDDIGGQIVCSVARLGAGASATLSVDMEGVTKGVHTNSAEVESDETAFGYEDPSNNTADESTTVRTRADMEVVSVVPTPGTVAVRRPFVWTLEVTNNTGPILAEADDVVVSQSLPAGMELTGTPTVTVISGTASVTTCTGVAGGTSFTCDLGTVSSGAELEISVPVRSLTVPSGGTSTNSATVSTFSLDVDPSNDTNSGVVNIQGSTLTGTVFRDFANDGGIDATDTGISGITMTLTGTAFDGSPVSRTTTTNASGQFSFGDLPEGSYTVGRGAVTEPHLVVGQQLIGDRGGDASTVPQISGIALGGIDTGSGYLFAFIPRPRIGIAKRTIGAPVLQLPDSSFVLEFRMVVENFSLEPIEAVSVTDPLAGGPPSLGSYMAGGPAAVLTLGSYTIQTAPSFTGACVGGTPNAGFNGAGDQLMASIASLAVGATCELSFTIRYLPLVPIPAGGYENQAAVEGTGAYSGDTPSDLSQNGSNPDPGGDDDPTNENAPTPLTPTLIADVTTDVDFPADVDAGELVLGRVTFRNEGPYQAENVGYTLTLSPNLSTVRISNLPAGATATYDETTGVVTFTGMPSILHAGQMASGDGNQGILVRYAQSGLGTSSVNSGITTVTNQGANALPDTDAAVVVGDLIADVTTALSFPSFKGPGSYVNGSVVFRNSGPSVASDVTYSLTLSPGLAGVSFGNLPGGAAASYDSGSGVVTFTGMPMTVAPLETVSGDGTGPITVQYVQPASAMSRVTSEIGTSTSQGANRLPDQAEADIVGTVTIGIAKAATVSGDTVMYEIRIENPGTAPVDSVSVVDDLSAVFGDGNFMVLGAPVLLVPPVSGSLTLNAGYDGTAGNDELVDQSNPAANSLPVGDAAVLQLQVRVTTMTDQGYGVGVYANTATLTVMGPGGSGPFTDESVDGIDVDPNANGDPSDDTGPTFTTLPVDATVGIGKQATVSGRRVTIDLTLVNMGNAEATALSVQDDLDPVFGAGNYQVVTSPYFIQDPGTLSLNAGFTGSGGGVEVTDPALAASNTLAPGDTAVIRFQVDIITVADMGNGLGVYENQAFTSSMGPGGSTGPYTDSSTDGLDPDPDADDDPGNNSVPTPIALPMADLSLEKVGPALALVGDTITYTITVTNGGPGAALDVRIQDVLPEGVAFLSASDEGVEAEGVITWPLVSEVAANAAEVRTVEVQIVAVGQWENVASVTSSLDPDPSNNDGSAPENKTTVTTAEAQADLEVIKTGPAEADRGDTITYVIATNNKGPNAARSVVVVDSLPEGAVFVSANRGAVASGRRVEWPEVALLGADDVLVDTVTVVVPEPAIYRNVASATSTTNDPDPTNNDGSNENSTVTTTVGTIDLAIDKSLTTRLKTGEEAVWEIVVSNLGTLATTGTTTVVDVLPSGLSYDGASGDGWSCSAQGQEVTCTFDEPIQPGSTTTITLSTLVTAPAGELVVNTATVSTPGEDPGGDNNSSTTEAKEVIGEGELILVKSARESSVEVGGLVRYELELRNVGLGPVWEIMLQDQLPRGFSLVPGSVVVDGQKVADPAGTPGPVLAFSVGDVEVGQTVRVSYLLRVGVGASPGENLNRAQAQSGGLPASNEASASVEVRLGVFSDLGHIMGRVWVEVSDSIDFDSDSREARYDPTLGVAGVRVYLQDGTSAVTDALGRYSFTDLRPRQWIVRLDERTLPAGMMLQPLTARHMGGGVSKFVDLTRGELARADFGDAEADTLLYQRVEDRATLGPVPEIAVPNRLAVTGGGSLTRGPNGWRSQRGLNGRVSNLGQRPGVAPWNYGAAQAGGTSLGSRGTLSPLFRRAGSTSGMALDPSADRHGGSGYVTGLRPGGFGEGGATYAGAGSGREAGSAGGSEGLRMLVSGFIEGRFDLRSLTDGELFQGGARDRFQDALLELASSSDDGKQALGARAAAFATGEVGEGYQLTLRFDTEKDPTRRFFNDIRPEEAYDVFGDASATLYEAQSKGRVFGAVAKGGSYLMYGDYNTSTYDAAQMLGRYSRTLNGVLHQYDSERAGFRAFASRDRFQQIVDEIPAMGISGPYTLSRPDGLMNSERVEIITRDRNQPGIILDIAPLERFTDYTIEPFTGRLIFKRPIPSVDEELNPVSIRVAYESETGGDEFWVFGADGRVAAGDNVSLGAGFVRDDAPGSRYDLFSANAGITLGEGTWINGEFARSDSAGVQDGTAWRVELRHASERLDFRGFYLTADSAFLNPSAGVGVGRTEMGLTGAALLKENTSLLAEVIRSEDDRSDATLTGARLAILQRMGEKFSAQLGYRYSSQDGTVTWQPAEVDDISALGVRLEAAPLDVATLFGEYEQDISDSHARRLAVGGDVQVLDRMRLYARHEFISSLTGPYTLNQGRNRNSTVFGVAADYREGQSVFSEYRAGNGISGRGAHAAIGLRNQWQLDEGLRLHTTVERVTAMDSVGSGDVLAVTGALEITNSPFWKGTVRAEYRATDREDHVLGSVGFARRVTDEITLLAQSLGSKVLDGGAFYERTRVGLAFRSDGRFGLNALARYEHRTDDNPMALEGPRDHRAHIVSTHLNLRPVDRLTARAQWAAKFATDEVAGMTIDQSAQLLSGRATVDLTQRFDLGIIGRSHFGEGQSQYGFGADLEIRLGSDLRLGLGYNWFGFTDEDLSLDEYTDKGFYIDLGWHFDEGLFGWGDDDDRRVGGDEKTLGGSEGRRI